MDVPALGADLVKLIDSFEDKNNSMKKTDEVKLALLLFSITPPPHLVIPMYQFLAQPQTKNINYSFVNDKTVEIVLKAEEIIKAEPHSFCFLMVGVDGQCIM